jgi:NAD(P)-dependent dehydrogenase (short-subunit alcohol dehydrogenase family)
MIEPRPLEGQTVVVTGASSGIGAAAALELAGLGAELVAIGRDRDRLGKLASATGEVGAACEIERADFRSLGEVQALAARLIETHPKIDVLVNNAGIVPGKRELTVDGLEATFQVNHLAPFLLTNLLLERLRAAPAARIVTTSSGAHSIGQIDLDDLQGERSFSRWRAYGGSKLANVLFTRELARRVEGKGIVASCCHPGVIRTRLGRHATGGFGLGWRIARPFFRSPKHGAKTLVYLAANPAPSQSGRYFADCKPQPVRGQAADGFLARELWQASEALLAKAAIKGQDESRAG